MKVKEYVEKATKELLDEQEGQVLGLVKTSLKNIAACKKTLKKLEKSHEKLLESDLQDLELDDLEY